MRPAIVVGIAVTALSAIGCGGDDTNATGGGDDGGGGSDATGSGDGGTGGDGATGDGGMQLGASVLERNNGPRREGMFIQPTLTKAAAATMTMDATFTATFTGNVYASPLYVENGAGGKGTFVVVTESNDVIAIDETTGMQAWKVNLGTPATASGAGCGNISPIGITGTPYIDLASRTIYLSAATGTATAITTHSIHALSLDDGSSRGNGFPYDVSTVTALNGGATFSPTLQNQRGSVTVVGGQVYVGYGGHAGDCNAYHGWVVVVPIAAPATAKGYRTPAQGAGIWGQSGVASDGVSAFVTTGNQIGANMSLGGEGILRLGALGAFSGNPADFFVPSNWQALDNGDVDVGGTGPMLVDVPGATPSSFVVAMGKSGVVHLANRANLGGIATGDGTTGEGVVSDKLNNGTIITAPASYKTANGSFVVFRGGGSGGAKCPAGQGGDLVAVKIGATSPPTLTTAWCAQNQGSGSPIVTTTDGTADAIVWTAGAESSHRLHGFDADTGALVFTGGGAGDTMTGLRKFASPIAVHGRIIVVGDGHLYAFKPQ